MAPPESGAPRSFAARSTDSAWELRLTGAQVAIRYEALWTQSEPAPAWVWAVGLFTGGVLFIGTAAGSWPVAILGAMGSGMSLMLWATLGNPATVDRYERHPSSTEQSTQLRLDAQALSIDATRLRWRQVLDCEFEDGQFRIACSDGHVRSLPCNGHTDEDLQWLQELINSHAREHRAEGSDRARVQKQARAMKHRTDGTPP